MAKFKQKFGKYAGVGDSVKVTIDGLTVTATIECDDDMHTPWDEYPDCYGIVSDWETRPKRPGERVLSRDRDSYRYYDWQASVAKARKERWNHPPYDEGTTGERAVRATEADFQRLKAWCNDEWHYVYIRLSVSKRGVVLDEYAASLGGIESDANEFDESTFNEMADEMLDEALKVGRRTLNSLCA